MKKGLLVCGLLFAAFVSFFNPLECQFRFSVPSIINCIMILSLLVKFYADYEEISAVRLFKWEKFFGVLLGICITLGYGLFKRSGFDIFYGTAITIAVTVLSLAFYIWLSIFVLKFFVCATENGLSAKMSR